MASSGPWTCGRYLETEPYFRFCSLPPEIRVNIYKLILCPAEGSKPLSTEWLSRNDSIQDTFDSTQEIKSPELYLGIETQILRTCSSIYEEAAHTMRTTNRFIKFRVQLPTLPIVVSTGNFYQVLASTRVPIMRIEEDPYARGFIMTHEIRKTSEFPEPCQSGSFVILHRDLDILCRALEMYKSGYDRVVDVVTHTVTIATPSTSLNQTRSKLAQGRNVDTFWCTGQSHTIPSYSRSLQEELIAPYRQHCHFFNFVIYGAISPDLCQTAMSEITRPLLSDVYRFMNGVREMKMAIKRVSPYACPEFYAKENIGSPPLVVRLRYDMYSHCAESTLRYLRQGVQEGWGAGILRCLGEFLFACVENARTPLCMQDDFQAENKQRGRLHLIEAKIYMFMGDLDRAETAIWLASTLLPGDREIEREGAILEGLLREQDD